MGDAALYLELFEQLLMGDCPPAGGKMFLPECGMTDSVTILQAAWAKTSFSESGYTRMRYPPIYRAVSSMAPMFSGGTLA